MAYDATAQTFTVADLIQRIRTRTIIPETSSSWPDERIVAEANDSLHSFITWAISQAGDGRLVETYNRSVYAALSSSYRAGSEFELPPLCVADTIEGVTWVTPDGRTEVQLGLISQANQDDYDTPQSYGDPQWYSLLSGRIRVYPQPTTSGVVRFTYQRRHPELILDSATDVGTVVSVSDAGSGYVNVALTGTSPFAVDDYVDLVSGKYPYRPLFTSLYNNNAGTCRLYIPFTYLSSVPVAGMRAVRSGQSPYLHLPLELRAALVEHASEKILRSIGDLAGAQGCASAANQEIVRVMGMLSPRTKRDRPRAVSWSSLLRRGIRGRYGGF